MEPSLTKLLDRLDGEQLLFTEMLTVSQDQVALLEMGQPDEDMVNRLVELLNRRQQLMDKIDRVSDSISDTEKAAGVKNKNPESLQVGSDQQQAYRNKVSAIRTIITSIQANDNKCQKLARSVLNRMGDKLVSARENKKAFQAYTTTNAYHDACFFDKKK